MYVCVRACVCLYVCLYVCLHDADDFADDTDDDFHIKRGDSGIEPLIIGVVFFKDAVRLSFFSTRYVCFLPVLDREYGCARNKEGGLRGVLCQLTSKIDAAPH